ncbi:MAG TPA: trimethylamine methyltransferase family protein, partial [Anaerolineae bacterium]
MPDFDFSLGIERITQIHQTALRILAEFGIRCDHSRMAALLAGMGCRVAGDVIYIPAELVAATLAAVPRRFKLYGRGGGRSVTVAAGGPTLRTNTGIFPNIYDFESGEVRRSVLRDVEESTRLLDALEQVDIVFVSLLDATDVPPATVTLAGFAATVANTTKPLLGPGVTTREEAEAIIAMAAAIAPGDLNRFPTCAPFVCPITPLRFPAGIVDAVMAVAEAGLPLEVISNPVMGLTAPYTIAGTVALGHAELLATAVMAHAIRPGLPMLNATTPSVADMRTLASTTGGPETGLLRRAVVEISNHLGLPSCVHGHTSSSRLDVQAADEKAINTCLLAGARPSLLGGLGALANVTLTSYATLVHDNERFAALRRIEDGVKVDEDRLAFDVIGRA